MKPAASNIAAENRAAAAAPFDETDRIPAAGRIGRRGGRPPLLARLPWSPGLILVGLATVGACVLLPLREENGELKTELANLERECAFIQQQADANAAFIDRIMSDPALADRMAMRMTNKPMAGTEFLNLRLTEASGFESSPYTITKIEPPPPVPAHQSDLPPAVAGLMRDVRSRVILMGSGVFLLGAAVILGAHRIE